MQARLNQGMTTFAKKVKEKRLALGLNQGELAKAAGLKQPDISKIELGLISETVKILGLARALKCSPYWLTGMDEEDKEQAAKPAYSIEGMLLAKWLDEISQTKARDDAFKECGKILFEAALPASQKPNPDSSQSASVEKPSVLSRAHPSHPRT